MARRGDAGEGARVKAWDGLEYLKLRQWRTAFETADRYRRRRLYNGARVLRFRPQRAEAKMIAVTEVSDRRRVLRISIDSVGDELELLIAACEIYRGHHDYKAVDEKAVDES